MNYHTIIIGAGLGGLTAGAKLGGGFSGAIYNGYLCAFEILRKRE